MTVPLSFAADRRIAILQLIRQAGALTRNDIAHSLDVSISQVSRITSELLESGLLVESRRSTSGLGRPSDLLALASDACVVVGLDLGSIEHRAILTNARGDVLATHVVVAPPLASRDAILSQITALTNLVIKQAKVVSDSIIGLGMALHALVDPIARIVHFWSGRPLMTSPWTDFALGSAVAEQMPGRIIAIDDVMRTLAISEARYGRDERDFILVLAEEGIAAAFVIDGMPYIGPNNIAGEIGHIAIDGEGNACECGNTGCLELRASERAVLANAGQWLQTSQIVTSLREHSILTIENVFEAADDGDRLAYQLIVEAGEALGHGLAVLLNLLGPRLIVLTGSMARSPIYCDAARRVMRLRSLSRASQNVRLETSQLDAFAGARGAASLVLDRLFSSHEENIFAMKR